MAERITPAQIGRIQKLLGESLEVLPLSRGVVQERVIGQGGMLKKRFTALVLALANTYFSLLSDEEAHEWLRKCADKSKHEATRLVTGYRRGAREEEIPDTEPCHVQVVSGTTLKETIPQVGLCVENFRYLKGWRFPDPPTTDSLFSLVPTLLRDSTGKTMGEQRELLMQTRQRLELPKSHLSNLGLVMHLAGAALTYKVAGRDIFAGKIARTETCRADGNRLYLRWAGERLNCGRWFWDVGFCVGPVGVLACGVEKALER